MDGGIREELPGGNVLEIIGSGGATEDNFPRFLNHFHNPLKPWPDAGLDTAVPLIDGQSSLLWAQEPPSLQGWSWHDAREYFYQALTAENQTARDQALANTFRAVGQVMHLIEDVSVPAHVRNNAHPPVISGYHFETWAKSHENDLDTNPLRPDIDLTGGGPGGGLVSISRLFDTDQYAGYNPEVTDSLSVGLAEYTNANFFSDDTIFADGFAPEHRHYFPHPSKAQVDPNPWIDPANNRQYLREAEEEGLQHVVLVSWLYWYRQVYFPQIDEYLPVGLDNAVYEEQARRLVPRAVGYAAALLDHFVRGRVDLIPDDSSGYGYVIVNETDEAMSGAFELWYDTTSDQRVKWQSWTLSINGKDSGNNRSANLIFTKSAIISAVAPVTPESASDVNLNVSALAPPTM